MDMFSEKTKCTACGAVMTFPQTVCPMCGTQHDMFRTTIHFAKDMTLPDNINPLPEIRASGYEHHLWTDLHAWACCYDAMSDPPQKIAVSTEALRETIATIVDVRKELASLIKQMEQCEELNTVQEMALDFAVKKIRRSKKPTVSLNCNYPKQTDCHQCWKEYFTKLARRKLEKAKLRLIPGEVSSPTGSEKPE